MENKKRLVISNEFVTRKVKEVVVCYGANYNPGYFDSGWDF